MDEVAKKLASLGLPGVLLAIMMATSGGMGGTYGLIAAIAGLGGPFGLMGGLAILGLMTAVGDVLSGYGIESLLVTVYQERTKSESLGKLVKELKDLPISDNLKLKLKTLVDPDHRAEAQEKTEPRQVEIIED